MTNLDLTDETAVFARNVGIEGDINEWTQICGFAYQPNPERDPGKLIVQFPQGKPGDYWILGTDYESYAVVYSCFELNGMVSLQAWIITRDPQPELETIENDISRLDGLIPTALKNLKEGNSKKETLESKVDRRKEKLDQINNLLTIDDDIEKEKIRLAWANVAEEEARLGRRNKMISEMQPKAKGNEKQS